MFVSWSKDRVRIFWHVPLFILNMCPSHPVMPHSYPYFTCIEYSLRIWRIALQVAWFVWGLHLLSLAITLPFPHSQRFHSFWSDEEIQLLISTSLLLSSHPSLSSLNQDQMTHFTVIFLHIQRLKWSHTIPVEFVLPIVFTKQHFIAHYLEQA